MANLCRNALGYVSQFVMSDTTVIGDIFAAVFETCTDPSWHVRQRSLYFLQIFMFRNLFLVPKEQLIACVETCLMDAQLEVGCTTNVRAIHYTLLQRFLYARFCGRGVCRP